MKRIYLALLLLMTVTGISAQNVVIGDRVPELKVMVWLGGQPPLPAQFTYFEFYQSSNPSCKNSVERLKILSEKLGDKLHIVVLTNEATNKVTPLLQHYVSEAMSVGIDPSGKIFPAFGITYVPSGVLVDAKNRALWLGNTSQMTEQLLDKLTH